MCSLMQVVRKMLNKLNISDDSIALAENGQQAVEFVTCGNNFDLVLMDIHMPVLVRNIYNTINRTIQMRCKIVFLLKKKSTK